MTKTLQVQSLMRYFLTHASLNIHEHTHAPRIYIPVLHECLCQLDVARGTSNVDNPLHGAWLRVVDYYVT